MVGVRRVRKADGPKTESARGTGVGETVACWGDSRELRGCSHTFDALRCPAGSVNAPQSREPGPARCENDVAAVSRPSCAINLSVIKRQTPSFAAARGDDVKIFDQARATGSKKRYGLSVWREGWAPIAESLRWGSDGMEREIP